MLKIRIMVVLIVVALLQGCAQTVDPKKVRRIDESTTRAEVEELLGEPVHVEETSDGLVYTYSYAIDADETGGLPDLGGCVGYCAAAFLLILPATWITDASGAFDETETLLISYGPDDLVAYAETEKQRERRLEIKKLALGGDPEAQFQMGSRFESDKAAGRKWLGMAADQGHVQAMYALAKISDEGSEERWRWYCLAAMQGLAPAQSKLGKDYRSGDAPGGIDLSKALFWYTLSDTGGYVTEGESQYCYYDASVGYTCARSGGVITQLRSELSDEDIAEVERLVADFEPNPDDCYKPNEAQAAD